MCFFLNSVRMIYVTKHTDFLYGHRFPAHGVCFEKGRLMRGALRSSKDARLMLRQLTGRVRKYTERFLLGDGRMIAFMHTYAENVFPALVKNNLWREGDGLKLMHKPGFLPPYDFNLIAAAGGKLETLLRDLRCPFYIDRLQGGLGRTDIYPYDITLTRYYESLLGERFLGFQMHEWASNLRSDEKRIRELIQKEGVEARDPAAWERLWDRVQAGTLPLFLEAYTAAEWRKRPLFSGLSSFLKETRLLYDKRVRNTPGNLIPADSYYMAHRTEIENGAKLLLPEAGWQIPNLRAQLAFTRGMAKAANVPWGIYYECWQNTEGYGFTIPYALRQGQDEWREDLLTKANGAALPFEKREHGGSSLSLLARAWRLAYFSGAGCLAEEYGVCNTFRDLKEAALSPYGEAKRDFLRFTEAFPDIGTPFTPVAVVLPKTMELLDITFGDRWLDYPLSSQGSPLTQAQWQVFRHTMETVFGSAGAHGNMGHVLKCGGLPGVCDIVYEDTPDINKYEYLIDLTFDGAFANTHRNVVSPAQADALLDSLLPCRTGGGLFAAYNRTASGWRVLVMNNDGIRHDDFLPDEKIKDAAVRTALAVKPGLTVRRAAGEGELIKGGDAYTLALDAGDWILLTLG